MSDGSGSSSGSRRPVAGVSEREKVTFGHGYSPGPHTEDWLIKAIRVYIAEKVVFVHIHSNRVTFKHCNCSEVTGNGLARPFLYMDAMCYVK